MHIVFNRLTIILCLSLLLSCTPEGKEENNTLFTRLSPEQSGIDFSNMLTPDENWNIIEYLYFYNGAGVATGDINNDGLIDIFFTSNQGKDQLFLNKGGMHFQNISEQAHIAATGWSTGVTMADVNADGWLDIYVCQVGGGYKGRQGTNRLYINNQDGTFRESAEEYGLGFSGFSTQAAFFDYDRDGDLDMYLLNHSVHSVNTYGPATLRLQSDSVAGDRLYRNDGKNGKPYFQEVTTTAGIYNSQLGYGLGISLLDYNNDGWTDIYISNDFHENDYLYENQRDGTFMEVGQEVFGHTSRYSMGNESGDLNNDGKTDILTLDMLPEDSRILRRSAAEDHPEVSDIKEKYGYGHQLVRNTLQLNQGSGFFSDIAPFSGVYATDWSWSPLIADFDNDGWCDIYITNGIVKRPNDLDYIQYLAAASRNGKDPGAEELISRMPDLKISNYMFQNSGGGSFEKVTGHWGLDIPTFSSGASYADLDNDGDLDLVVNNTNEHALLFENNEKNTGNHYLEIALQGDHDNLNALGARLKIFHGGDLQQRDLFTTRGFMSAVAPRVHFGLGDDPKVDSMEVIWPDGYREVIRHIPSDTLIALKQGQGSPEKEPDPAGMIGVSIDSFPYVHHENNQFRDYKREPLIPYNLSREGPAVAVGDVDGNGLEDVYAGGAQGQAGALFYQQADGTFIPDEDPIWAQDRVFEDVDARFVDVDNDGDLDLSVASGGNQFVEGHPFLQDRIYLNRNGQFERLFLPGSVNSACIRWGDIDADGLPEAFIGVRSKVGAYGVAPQNYLLHNLGEGRFEEDQSFHLEGMVTDATWIDVDRDGQQDLAVVGDWMPVTIFHNENGKLQAPEEVEQSRGWWRTLTVSDINQDGFDDLIAGNMGKNSKIRVSGDRPAQLLLNDFDRNGQTDPVLLYWQGQELIPFASRDALGKQMPVLNKQFRSYAAYAKTDELEKVFREMQPETLKTYRVDHMSTTAYINQKGMNFKTEVLPAPAQWGVVNSIIPFREGGQLKYLLVGNTSETNIDLGYYDALPGMVVKRTAGGWIVDRILADNFFKGPLTHAARLTAGGVPCILIGMNDGPMKLLRLDNGM